VSKLCWVLLHLMSTATFRKWVAAHWSPLCLVIASPEAEALCAASGLCVVDLLAPHCVSTPNAPIRTSEVPFRLREFTLRIAYPAECEALCSEARGGA